MTKDAQEEGTHFFTMAIQLNWGSGIRTLSRTGTLTPNPGATRIGLYFYVLDLLLEQAGLRRDSATNLVTLDFDIQPNSPDMAEALARAQVGRELKEFLEQVTGEAEGSGLEAEQRPGWWAAVERMRAVLAERDLIEKGKGSE